MVYNEYECTPLYDYESTNRAIRQIKGNEKHLIQPYTHGQAKSTNEMKIRLGAQFTLVAGLIVAASVTFSSI